eukprot:m.216106 g.216106  ORF g.216106 m.216106 type:complete len:227 (-) comp10780_c0_seq20:619-1299(-)
MCVLPTTAARCTSWSPRVESTAATSAPSSRSTSMRSSRLRMHAICSSENPCRSRQSTDRLPCATSSFSTSSEEHSTIPLPTKEPEHPPYEPPAPHLDLCSSEFDPAAALAAESLALPYPKIKPLDNLAACRYRLLAKDEREQHRTQRQAKEAAAKLSEWPWLSKGDCALAGLTGCTVLCMRDTRDGEQGHQGSASFFPQARRDCRGGARRALQAEEKGPDHFGPHD